jgi:FMN phosphatase YigB (HAD superfamily)
MFEAKASVPARASVRHADPAPGSEGSLLTLRHSSERQAVTLRRVPIRSFDIFDTVLTRAVGDPGAVLRLVGQQLRAAGIIRCSAEAFARTRQQADEDVIAHGRVRPTLAAIYDELGERLDLDPEARALALAAELAIEREVSRPVPGAPELVERARAHSDGGIVFVSDTPLPSTFLAELLEQAGLWVAGDSVYASGEVGASKFDGVLFDRVREDLAVAASEIQHIGDNPHSDVRMARARGWHAEVVTDGRLNRYEELLELHNAGTDGLSSKLAGASRLGRLDAVRAGVDPAIAGVAAGVAAPLFLGYALWLAERSRRLGLDRLMFLARDGEVLLQVAGPVLAAAGVGVDCRYLLGSRQAWQFAAAGATGCFEPGRLLEVDDTERSARSILSRVHLDPSMAWRLTGHPRFAPGTVNQPLVRSAQNEVLAALERDPLRDRLVRDASAQHALLLAYVAEAGWLDGRRTGMVDIGWLGHVGRALERSLQVGGLGRPDAWLYLGLLEKAEAASGPELGSRQHAFLFDLGRGRGLPHRLYGVHNLLEAFCQATHGRTVGYRAGAEEVEAELESGDREEALLAWGQAEYRETLRLTVDHFLGTLPDLATPVDLRPVLGAVLTEFWERPSLAEARAWGALPFDVDVAGGQADPLARAVRFQDAVRELRRNRRFKLRPEGSWRAGVARQSPAPWRAAFGATAEVKRQLPRARRLSQRLRASRSRSSR